MTFGKECRFEDVKERMTKKTVLDHWQDIEDITIRGIWHNDAIEHDFYIVTHGSSELQRIENEIKMELISKGLIEPDDRFDADNIFEIAMDLNSCSHFLWGFADEYDICHICENVVSLHDYGRMPDYWIAREEGFLACGDCVRSDEELREQYIEDITNNPQIADTLFQEDDLIKMGYHKCNKEFEAGLREFQNDNPETILEQARELLNDDEFVFRIDEMSPFDIHFSLYSRNSEDAEA